MEASIAIFLPKVELNKHTCNDYHSNKFGFIAHNDKSRDFCSDLSRICF